MRIKTFYANSMAEALQNVKSELGPEALILSSKEIQRKSRAGYGEKPGYEVVAALDDSSSPEAETSQSAPDTFRGLSSPPIFSQNPGQAIYSRGHANADRRRPEKGARIDPDYNEMRRMIYSMTRPAAPAASMFSDAVSYQLYHDLISNEVNDWLACKLLDEAQRALPQDQRSSRSSLFRSLAEVARGFIHAGPATGGLPGKRVVAFVGPTGVGKTTAIAKLAARLALEARKKVLLVSLDSFRIGGAEQLRTYAGIMGLPFRAVANVSDLPETIRENASRDYILIDTTGRGPRDLEEMQDLMQYLRDARNIEKHLVLSANTKPVDMQESVDRFGACNPDHLLFTKLDETSTFGPIFNELVRTQKSPSYFSDGQRVPEDFHAMPKERVVDFVLNAN